MVSEVTLMRNLAAAMAVGLILAGQAVAADRSSVLLSKDAGADGVVLVDQDGRFAPLLDPSTRLHTGDRVELGHGASASLTYEDHCKVHLAAETTTKIDTTSPCKGGFFMLGAVTFVGLALGASHHGFDAPVSP
jgi:hypothetical protein